MKLIKVVLGSPFFMATVSVCSMVLLKTLLSRPTVALVLIRLMLLCMVFVLWLVCVIVDMYERYSKRPFYRSNRASSWAVFGTWLCFGVALGLCVVGCVSCGVHREFVHIVEVDKANHSDTDSCTVEIWRQYFPRRITKFRIK